MTTEEKIHVAKMLTLTYKIYGKEFDLDMGQLFVDDLADQKFDDIIRALSAFRTDKKNRLPPNVADILSLINPEIDDSAKAQNIAGLVLKAVSKFGWAQPSEAKEMMGPVGWEIVQRYGGWQYVCENLGEDISVTTFTAQVRDAIKAQLQISSSGAQFENLLDYAPAKRIQDAPKKADEVLRTIMPKREVK